MDFQNWLISKIKEHWNVGFLGDLSKIEVISLQKGDGGAEADKSTFEINLLLTNIATALSTVRLLGSASAITLKSVKKRMDIAAGNVFAAFMDTVVDKQRIAVSEGKDEKGDIVDDPLKNLLQNCSADYGLAVDVVDGTTLAAKGLGGAYTLAAAAKGLQPFPDMQAYTIGAPVEVLKEIDFYKTPEDVIEDLVKNLSEYYKKSPDQLKIVTHSSDTGKHHITLIKKLEDLGVQVIIPEPVIVEPPYVLGMALRRTAAPDCMIGVFGLPEIVINTLLLAAVSNEYELWFRIASNTMLKFPDDKNLNKAFAFDEGELENLKSLHLNANLVYSKKTIVTEPDNICSSSTALTNDPVLNLDGCRFIQNNIVKVESLFCGYEKNVVKLVTLHRLNNAINYAACYPMKIDDISLILPADTSQLSEFYHLIVSSLNSVCGGEGILYTLEKDLHITAFEFGVHYGGYDHQNDLKVAVNELFSINDIGDEGVICEIHELCRNDNSIIIDAQFPDSFSDHLKKRFQGLSHPFFNVKAVPGRLHITIAYFSKYLSREVLDEIDHQIETLNQKRLAPIYFSSVPELVHIIQTPFVRKKI